MGITYTLSGAALHRGFHEFIRHRGVWEGMWGENMVKNKNMLFKYWEECPCVPAMLFPCAGTIYFVAGEDPDEKKFVSTEKTYFCRSGIGGKIWRKW